MRIAKTILNVLLLTLCAVGCGKSGEGASTPLSLRLESESVSCSADGCFIYVEADGSWTLALTGEGGQSVSWARLNKTSGSGNSSAVMSYDYNNSANSRTCTVKLASGSQSVEKVFTQRGNDPSAEPPAEVPGWMEIPEQKSTLPFYCHDFTLDGKTYRNYSFGWDGANRLAQWVAYPLCNFYTAKKTNRGDSWNFDPLVPSFLQPDLTRSYSGRYDRGHQLPSADRLVCDEANAQTFYFTNMTPQRDVFNQGIWGAVEGTVRGWSSRSDTLYVVTGCLMKEGASSTTDCAGNTCPIPDAYYKAILRYSKGSTLGWGGYSGIGIYMDHNKTYSEQSLSKSMVMSLKDLEAKLDYKLFPALETVLGKEIATKIKSQDPTSISFWGL